MARKENDYLEFKNPIHVIWRKGTPEDPYVDKLDIVKVVNQRLILSEIPDYLTRVKIPNMREINHERFIEETLAPNEYYCDYTNGFVYFHASKEADTITVAYKGRGIILYPSTRIIHTTGENVKETLYELIEKSKIQIQDLIDQTQVFDEYLSKLIISTEDARQATDNAIAVTDEAQYIINKLENAWLTTQLIWKPPVGTKNDIEATYPNPEIGWTTQAEDTGERYRWDGNEWVHIDSISTSIPLATEQTNGAMSKEDFVKLRDISPRANEKTIVFVLPQENLIGIQDPHVVFPYVGDIIDLQVTTTVPGLIDDTMIRIEKSKDFVNWKMITEDEIRLPREEYIADEATIKLSKIEKDEIFRVVISQVGGTHNISININVNLDPTQ